MHTGKIRNISNFNYNENVLADHAAAPLQKNKRFWEIDKIVTDIVKDQNQKEW